jgi:uncharacterized membrane protein YkvA (DUF1232 family)
LINSETIRSNYSETGFWNKVKKWNRKVGKEFTQKALVLYYALFHPQCNPQDRLMIYGALAYFIIPIDIGPDFLPGGFTDDLAALTFVVIKLASFIDESVRERANQKAVDFFGE